MRNNTKTNVTILGAGSWGIALADHCCKLGHNVTLWEFEKKAAEHLAKTRERPQVLKHVKLHEDIQVTSNLEKAVFRAQLVLLVAPSHVIRSILERLKSTPIPPDAVLINCAKGIEIDSLCRMSEIVDQELANFSGRYAVLSGPSHAEEVSREIPTAVVVAAFDDAIARDVQQSLSSIRFRIYRSLDVIGVELGGALKNVIAIAAGICDGAGFGDNTKAALQPRGLAEIARLGRVLGANPLTFAGLSGMGDLIVTCMSKHSRNRYVGEQIGSGKTLDEVVNSMVMVAEGVRTSQAAVQLASKWNVDLPICEQIYNVLFQQKNPRQALDDLMSREVKPEVWY